jgi:hypothetical protein
VEEEDTITTPSTLLARGMAGIALENRKNVLATVFVDEQRHGTKVAQAIKAIFDPSRRSTLPPSTLSTISEGRHEREAVDEYIRSAHGGLHTLRSQSQATVKASVVPVAQPKVEVKVVPTTLHSASPTVSTPRIMHPFLALEQHYVDQILTAELMLAPLTRTVDELKAGSTYGLYAEELDEDLEDLEDCRKVLRYWSTPVERPEQGYLTFFNDDRIGSTTTYRVEKSLAMEYLGEETMRPLGMYHARLDELSHRCWDVSIFISNVRRTMEVDDECSCE